MTIDDFWNKLEQTKGRWVLQYGSMVRRDFEGRYECPVTAVARDMGVYSVADFVEAGQALGLPPDFVRTMQASADLSLGCNVTMRDRLIRLVKGA